MMGKAAHDLGDCAAIDAEVEGSPILLPAENLDGVEDVASGEVVTSVGGHSWSLTPFRRIEGDRLERDDQRCDSRPVGPSLLVAVQAG